MVNRESFDKTIAAVLAEREYQDRKWGEEFDSKNTPNDWVAYICAYLGSAVTMPWNAETFRTRLVKTAALCFAAIEWLDRTNGNMPKRHYD